MAPLALGSVEVQKDKGSRIWYSGHVVDVKSDTVVLVAFENDVWPKTEYPVSSIRKPPKLSTAELEKFSPHVGEEVELRVNASEHAPAGWGVAVIRNIKHDFFFVALISATSADDTSNAIVEKDMLRPKTVFGGCSGGALKEELYKLPKELDSWIHTADAVGCFAHIEEQSGLIFIQTLKCELKLVGDMKTIQRARMLLQLHVKHQGQIQNFQETLEKQLTALEKKRNRIEGTGYKHSIEFQIDASCASRIIGKRGESIRALQAKFDVNISILPQDGGDEEERTVRIFGNSQDMIDKARADVEYVEEVMPVEPRMRAWILGRGGKTIQGFKDSAGLAFAHLDQDGEQLSLKGTRNSVQDAKAMFETHLMYYPVFHQMDEEMEQMVNQLQEYGDANARWEWGWYRDEEEDYTKGSDWKGKGGKGGKGDGKSSKGGKKGKPVDWEEPTAARPSRAKDGKGSKGGSQGSDWRQREEDWEEPTTARPTRTKGGRGSKGSSQGNDWYAREEEEDYEESAPEHPGSTRGSPRRGAGGLRGGRSIAAGGGATATPGGRAALAAAAGPDRDPQSAPSGRRMGKKGLRY